MRSRHDKTRGFVLKKALHDTGKYVDMHVFTEEFGKLRVKVKGLKNIKSKMAATLDPYHLLRMDLYNVTDDVHILTGITVEASFPWVITSLPSMTTLWKMVEIIDTFLPFELEHPEIFEIYLETLAAMERTYLPAYCWFLLQVLHQLGYIDITKKCTVCEGPLEHKVVYKQESDWMFTCMNCKPEGSAQKDIPFYIVKICMFGQTTTLHRLTQVSLSPQEWQHIAHFLEEVMQNIAGKKLHSFGI